jgi:hypothetical protein
VTPYSRGLVSRCPRLAEKTSAPVSAATPTTALATMLRTGTAVRPAPGCNAIRMPSMAGAKPIPEVSAARYCGRRRPPGPSFAGPALAARQVGQAVAAIVISTAAATPTPKTRPSARIPG